MGKIIAVIGVDGSGKSTLIEKTKWESSHFYKGVKKNKGSSVNKRVKIDKKVKNFKFFVGTILKIYIPNFYKLIKYRYFSKVNLIFDRYTYDYLSSLKCDRESIFKKLIYFMFKTFPSPDFVIFLSVDPEIAYERKNEFNIEHLRKKQDKLLDIVNDLDIDKLKIFDSSINIDKAYEFFK